MAQLSRQKLNVGRAHNTWHSRLLYLTAKIHPCWGQKANQVHNDGGGEAQPLSRSDCCLMINWARLQEDSISAPSPLLGIIALSPRARANNLTSIAEQKGGSRMRAHIAHLAHFLEYITERRTLNLTCRCPASGWRWPGVRPCRGWSRPPRCEGAARSRPTAAFAPSRTTASASQPGTPEITRHNTNSNFQIQNQK